MRAIRAVACACVAFVSLAPTGGGSDKKGLHGNNFYVNCRFSHTSNDDPIVYPGEPGRSHHHTFFGNTSTDASSTPTSLRGATTTCKPRADRAAYWVPTLFKDGREVRPAKGQFYYNLRGFDQLRAFPAGLKMIAGNAHARRPQSTRVVYWTCGGSGGVRLKPSSTAPRTCPVVRATFRGMATRPSPTRGTSELSSGSSTSASTTGLATRHRSEDSSATEIGNEPVVAVLPRGPA